MSLPTYLEYTCAPNPLTEGVTQDILVIATLKTANQLGVPLTSTTISEVILDFGTVGTGATNLTNTAFTTANIEAPSNWTKTTSGVTCTLTPTGGHGMVSSNALVFVIKNVPVNSTQGNVTLTIKEAATPAPQASNVPPTTTTASPGIETIVLPKVAAADTLPVISADPEAISSGNDTTLTWSGGNSADVYTLLYVLGNTLNTITKHTNNALLGADDVYPNTSLVPADPSLVLQFSTTFVLQIQKPGGGDILYY